ncbi:MAG TPA: glutamate racemase [Terracidiphilus sp.]|jgi:glutamate racemase
MSDAANNSGATFPTIGVFDSGFGGLTVLRALMAQLPRARYAFFGDTARLPYGSKSRRTIARYAAQCAQFLVSEQGAEYLVIACNTASALALDAIQDAVQVPVLGVIEPGAEAARAASRSGDVLVIATDATVQSHAYAAACRARGLRALEKACPLLVPLVEEGWTGPLANAGNLTEAYAAQAASAPPQVAAPPQVVAGPQVHVTAEVIRIYLAELIAEASAQGMKPDVLLLGCTHYPLLRPLLEGAVPPNMRVIDSANATAEAAVKLFGQTETYKRSPSAKDPNAQFPSAKDPAAHVRCFATDSIEKFERLGSRFLGQPTGKVELVDLGG